MTRSITKVPPRLFSHNLSEVDYHFHSLKMLGSKTIFSVLILTLLVSQTEAFFRRVKKVTEFKKNVTEIKKNVTEVKKN